MSIRTILSVTLILLLCAGIASAQNPMNNRSRLEFRGGVWSGSEVSGSEVIISSTSVETNTLGGAVSLEYTKFYKEHLAYSLSVGVLAININTQTTLYSEFNNIFTITPVLLGVRYYFPNGSRETSFRPFVTAKIGPYIASDKKVTVDSDVLISTKSQMVFGGYLGGGVDLLLNRRFFIALDAGYHALPDFGDPVGVDKNYSGGEFSFGLGIFFGK